MHYINPENETIVHYDGCEGVGSQQTLSEMYYINYIQGQIVHSALGRAPEESA